MTSLLKPGRRSLAVPANGRTSGIVSVRALSAAFRDGRAARARVQPLPALSAPSSLDLATLRRSRALVLTCTPSADGTCAVRATVRGRSLGTGSATALFARPTKVRARLSSAGLRQLRPGDTVVVAASVPGDGPKTVRIRIR